MAARSCGITYIVFTAKAQELKRQLEHARSRQPALARAGLRGSDSFLPFVGENTSSGYLRSLKIADLVLDG
ncbi:hypothetical protein F9C07_11710 [Aspergillus flavus]|uniref:Uncharacterized protein n=1 Tax=Aspergillus flavus (strain ATCC 200026 / FGSC A1120 / IAM 13836 / NRRL 3357 / JCM 12722 / SRRC 167) TaxID=332952 RepID=A0A7U2N395_ASPFN|nr:hypothetical protein F9C07_11710 [Aspergillus flavus]